MYKNPFAGKGPSQIYEMLSSSRSASSDLPRWPEEKVQKIFITRSGVGAVKFALDYLEMMRADGAFKEDWKGLDYGCGFGRFSSLMLQFGPPENLILCDAMPSVENMIRNHGFENEFYLVPQVIEDNTDIGQDYSMILAWSVFTHFNEKPFIENIKQLYNRLEKDGRIYITVSDEDFIGPFCEYWYGRDAKKTETKYKNELREKNVLFARTLKDPNRWDFWGRLFVTRKFLDDLPLDNHRVNFVGSTEPSQKMYVISRRS